MFRLDLNTIYKHVVARSKGMRIFLGLYDDIIYLIIGFLLLFQLD